MVFQEWKKPAGHILNYKFLKINIITLILSYLYYVCIFHCSPLICETSLVTLAREELFLFPPPLLPLLGFIPSNTLKLKPFKQNNFSSPQLTNRIKHKFHSNITV